MLFRFKWNLIELPIITLQERTEENNFMDAIMSTSVIRHLMTFLKNKGKCFGNDK